jgi:hypothetical protein
VCGKWPNKTRVGSIVDGFGGEEGSRRRKWRHTQHLDDVQRVVVELLHQADRRVVETADCRCVTKR